MWPKSERKISLVIESVLIGLIILVQISLTYAVEKLSKTQSKYEDEQLEQGWQIHNLENDKYELKSRVNILEEQVNKNADNDNVCD